jgi:cytidylate kinase
MTEAIPCLTIDGPSGSGKGTVAARVAALLGWPMLDSGALYRLAGLAARRGGADFADGNALAAVAAGLQVRFADGRIWLDGVEVSNEIRTETAGNDASRVAAQPAVRAALLDWQRDFLRPPGLVADGRDMGTTVFPQAAVKVFLTASPEERARRRYKQLIEKGFEATLSNLTAEIRERDERDRSRAVSPLVPAPDAVIIDSTDLGIDQVVAEVVAMARRAWPGAGAAAR